MIRLFVEPYCHRCPKFDPEVRMITYGDNVLHSTQVTCSNADRCRQIAGYIREELIKEREIENERHQIRSD